MKDEMQNLTDLIGALAEDIEEIKTTVKTKDAPDKDGALERLAVKLEPCIRFFGGSTPENINGIFRSKESIAAYRKSQADEVIMSLQAYTDANDKNMRERGIPTTKDLLYKILEVLTDHVEKDKRILEKVHPKQGFTQKFWQAIRPDRVINGIRRLWHKIPDGWHKNLYAWTGIVCTLVFFALFAISWMQWREYREENKRLRTVADKHQVTTVMLNGLYPELAVTIGAYERLVETIGIDSTLTVFNRQLEKVRNEENKIRTTKNKVNGIGKSEIPSFHHKRQGGSHLLPGNPRADSPSNRDGLPRV